jgi:hypothetical protein
MDRQSINHDADSKIKSNYPDPLPFLERGGNAGLIQNMMEEYKLEELGRDIASNIHLEDLLVSNIVDVLFILRIDEEQHTRLCHFVWKQIKRRRSMLPFLQNANILQLLHLDGTNLQSEGFGLMEGIAKYVAQLTKCVAMDVAQLDSIQI